MTDYCRQVCDICGSFYEIDREELSFYDNKSSGTAVCPNCLSPEEDYERGYDDYYWWDE